MPVSVRLLHSTNKQSMYRPKLVDVIAELMSVWLPVSLRKGVLVCLLVCIYVCQCDRLRVRMCETESVCHRQTQEHTQGRLLLPVQLFRHVSQNRVKSVMVDCTRQGSAA